MSFEDFWNLYPRRVGKKAARKKYEQALRETTHEKIMEGVERYVRDKPDYADWAHPKTWLNQGRWDDDYGESGVGKGRLSGPPMTPSGLSPTLHRLSFGDSDER